MKNKVKEKLKNNEAVIGTFLSLNSPEVALLLAKSGYDFVMADFEHGAMSNETLGQEVTSILYGNSVPLARIPVISEEAVKKALDTGAYGIMAPMVNKREDVRNFLKYSKLPPEGVRGFGPVRANDFFTEVDKYIAFEKTEILRIIQIETKEALDNIEDLLKEGPDIAFIGPYDLSFSMGYPGDIENEKVMEAVKHISEASIRNGVIPGIMANRKNLKRYLDMGIKFIIMGVDSLTLYNAAKDDIEFFKENL